MSPLLSRPNYFLNVLNEQKVHQVAEGSPEHELQDLLLRLAQSVQAKQVINPAIVQKINAAFQRYNAIQLKLSVLPPEDQLSVKESVGERKEVKQGYLFHAEFTDPPEERKRMYMEAIVSLLEAMEKGPPELQNCVHCDNWFIPYQRAQVAKFCSTKCRNRYNYLLRRTQ